MLLVANRALLGLWSGLQVLQSMKEEERRSLTPLQLRKKAAEFALKTVDQQREQFKRCVTHSWQWGNVGNRSGGELVLEAGVALPGGCAGPAGEACVCPPSGSAGDVLTLLAPSCLPDPAPACSHAAALQVWRVGRLGCPLRDPGPRI